MDIMEQRLAVQCDSEEYAYRMMNELANVLRSNGQGERSISYYKKALLCVKRRHKINYLSKWETAEILKNIASAYHELGLHQEAGKYANHAHEVCKRLNTQDSETVSQ